MDSMDSMSTLAQVMAWYQQTTAIIWAYVDRDPWRNMVSLSLKEFIKLKCVSIYIVICPSMDK